MTSGNSSKREKAPNPRALVIGHGSIGARHARLLVDRGCATAVVTRQNVETMTTFEAMEEALTTWAPAYVVIANPTDRHAETLANLAKSGYRGTALVEKPLFAEPAVVPPNQFSALYVGYNLRFHPVLRALRDHLAGERVLTVQAYAGQYLPAWRPGTDYRQSYSASATRGGGVLRDLSHELDYLGWILGAWRAVAASGGRTSHLVIDSDDAFSLLLDTERCNQVTLQLNYLDRLGRRRIVVNTDSHTIEADLIGATLDVDGTRRYFELERDDTYRAMHEAILTEGGADACSAEEACTTLDLIEAAARAARERQWIRR